MLPRDILDRITAVLVRARNPNNIGAAARAMHDFGLSRLAVVNDFAVPFEAARSAIDASEVLRNARNCPTLAEAVADCTLVVGTTAVGERDLQHPLLPLAEAAPAMLAALRREPQSRIALLFGSEKTGLSNDELSLCNLLLTIPMYEHEGVRHPSMNLGQAVAVCLYELVRQPASDETSASPLLADVPDAPQAAELDRLSALLGEMLEATGYTRRHPARTTRADLNRLVRRMALDRNSAQVWMGIVRQVLWKIDPKTQPSSAEPAPHDEPAANALSETED